MIRFDSGDLRLTILSAGTLWLDGGAMFGVVPKVLWAKLRPPDERNRIRLGMNPSWTITWPDARGVGSCGGTTASSVLGGNANHENANIRGIDAADATGLAEVLRLKLLQF